jgi:hypothetical protein
MHTSCCTQGGSHHCHASELPPLVVEHYDACRPLLLPLLQAEQLMRTLMQRERRRLWNWWDDTKTRDTENSRGRCVCSCPRICRRLDLSQSESCMV